MFREKIRKVIPNDICPGCVFADQVDFIGDVINGAETPAPEGKPPQHVTFI